ncbi:LOW QUALITY PROTEIN: hypothetical protein Cgig2_003860 [Carnegiea gigantea]|uniref:Uncharacterized protein n=1 Tax=Carnegiea gigantea TaxID=171969 RepID=A0A9Q1QBB0_9CARY|nr:LOW QUALITY PROTEIN: hypothetical protein Cgig2_003860 [Carnegiea gigantea]
MDLIWGSLHRVFPCKSQAKITLWATNNISFAGRAQLLNSVIFGMFNYWATIFVLPQEVIDQMNQICRNYPWGGIVDYQRSPFTSWSTTYTPKKYGGIEFGAWNKANIAKIIWAIAEKKDLLWVKWVHGRYLKNQDWWDYQAPPDCSWYWKKLMATKELFKKGISNRATWQWPEGQHYTAKKYWLAIKQWWPTTIVTSSTSNFMHSILTLKGPKKEKMIAHAIYAAGIYQTWRTRNEKTFAQHQLPAQTQFKHTKNTLHRASLH